MNGALADGIREAAASLGFAAVGFAEAGPAQSLDDYQAWLDSGRAAGMTYLRRHAALRADPRNLLPEALAMICVAARYPVHPAPGEGFAMHARGRDYHNVLGDKLRWLAERLRSWHPALRTRTCVDSAPSSARSTRA